MSGGVRGCPGASEGVRRNWPRISDLVRGCPGASEGVRGRPGRPGVSAGVSGGVQGILNPEILILKPKTLNPGSAQNLQNENVGSAI